LGYAAHRDPRARLETSQREVFHQITKPPDGKRELLCRAANKLYKTLPQYAMEVMEFASRPGGAERRRVHLFGTTQISALHARTLRWLGERYDLRMYYLNPFVAALPNPPTASAIQELARRFAETPADSTGHNELLRLWGLAGIESLAILPDLLHGPFRAELVPSVAAALPRAPPPPLAGP